MKVIAQIIVWSLILVSCDLITTRTPEEPIKPGQNFIPSTSPQILFQNLKSAVEEKILENYLACLIDTSYLRKKFQFIPAIGSITQYPILNSFGLNAERQYFNNMKSSLKEGSSVSLLYSRIVNTPLGDSAIYSLDYSLRINANNITFAGEYSGSAIFKIFRDSREQWVIVEWQDIKKENLPCWSDLKGRIY